MEKSKSTPQPTIGNALPQLENKAQHAGHQKAIISTYAKATLQIENTPNAFNHVINHQGSMDAPEPIEILFVEAASTSAIKRFNPTPSIWNIGL